MAHFMKCGHTANALDKDGNPICAICYGETEDAEIEADDIPDLQERKARCSECGKTKDSDFNLPFFEHRPEKETDSYYCGCSGWE